VSTIRLESLTLFAIFNIIILKIQFQLSHICVRVKLIIRGGDIFEFIFFEKSTWKWRVFPGLTTTARVKLYIILNANQVPRNSKNCD
jgi:hypothetical protein